MATTAIMSELDFRVSAVLARLAYDDALYAVCSLIGKHIGDYAHLDHGRMKMTAGNLARGAAKADPEFLAKLIDATKDMADKPVYKRKSRAKAKAVPVVDVVAAPAPIHTEAELEEHLKEFKVPAINWPSNKRFKFAHLVDGEWKYTYIRKNEDDAVRA